MTITYQVEKWRDALPDMAPLFVDHWHEIALGHNKVPLDVDIDHYQALCDAGILHIVTVRDDEKLVGYHVGLVHGHLHYASTKHCMTDVYFVLPAYRKGRIGICLFKRVEAELKSLGVIKIITGAKLHTANGRSGLLFKHLGYRATETVFTKLIGD